MSAFTKIVRLGRATVYQDKDAGVFCKIEWDGSRLSITGVHGPLRNGDALGGCGQIDPRELDFIEYAPGWDAAAVQRFAETWKRWHLNDMRAGCEHQRADHWDQRPIDPAKPLNAYGRHFRGQQRDSWNMLAWVRADEHPEGLLGRPCPVCGYKYGTAWKTEAVPAEVVEYLRSLPDTDQTPAWV